MTERQRPRSSRPTTSAASTARRWTARSTTSSAARSPGCSATCAASRSPSCGSGSGATCACRRRRWRAGCATGSSPRARRSSTPGMVGTEMLYFLVGSHELDGGAMVTASHNPKAYTGVKLVREGALALSGDAGIGDIRDLVLAGMPATPPGGGDVEVVDVYDDFQRHALASIEPERRQAAEGRRRRRQRHGRPDGRPAARAPRPRPGRDLLGPRRRVPRPRAEPAAAREPPVRDRPGARRGRRPRDRLGRRRRPLLLHRRQAASSSTATSSPRCSRRLVLAQAARAPTILYDVRASRAVPDTVTAAGGTPHINRVGHAFFKQAMREHGAAFGGEVSGHYYFREFWCADSGTLPALFVLELLGVEGRAALGAGRRVPRALLHLRRDQLRGRRPGRRR